MWREASAVPFGPARRPRSHLAGSYLRRKFAPVEVDPIETVRGVGYRYQPRLIGAAGRTG